MHPPPFGCVLDLCALTSEIFPAGRTLPPEDLDWFTNVHAILHAGMKRQGPRLAPAMAHHVHIYTMKTSRSASLFAIADMQAEKLCPPGRVLLIHQILPLTGDRTADAVLTDPLNLDTLPNSTESLPTLANDTTPQAAADDHPSQAQAAQTVELLADGMGSPSFSASQELASALGSDEVGAEAQGNASSVPWPNTMAAAGSNGRRLTKSEVAIDPMMEDPWQDSTEGSRHGASLPDLNLNPPFDSAPPRTRRRHRLSTNRCVAQRLY